ncbi:protocadherin-11 X-linked isoform X3 [Chiloscyllium plagiosum]|uniref:protocadherin-11 X-linked isoform X3 n=1 Tax=Chiloscyllium plagiosum TaxID=36176 RepID=UPI001CB82E59|nr:protocadherin-11 X-linked isoform X3 [Chiloscyllium plagiosum]
MDALMLLLLMVLMLLVVSPPASGQERDYSLREELPDNVLVANLVRDLNLTAAAAAGLPLTFKLVSKTGDAPLLRVEGSSGELYTTAHRIDRERLCANTFSDSSRCFYEVEVAVLPNEVFQLVKMRFLIEDVNDNAPLFPSAVINISIPENTAVNSRYSVPSALDPDAGINGIQHYELLKGQSVFGLDIIETPEGDKWPQLIVQQSLDREQKDTYVMKIKVEDGGQPPRSSTAILQITVTDVNDNRPVFKEGETDVHIPEDAPVGTSVVQLHATDADLGSNAVVSFSFSNQVSALARRLFAVNPSTGLITVRQPLDREEFPVHKLTVLASDGSSTPSRAVVTINITDVNDNVPTIDTRYIINPVNGTVLLSENAPLNTKIALITVTDEDADLNGKVTCFTDHDVPYRLKPVFESQFLLETAALLDYETTKEYTIKIVASDAGKPPLNQSATVVIKLKDENDNAPVFNQPVIGLSIPENNTPGTQLTKISATDADSGKNAEITYLLGPNAPSIFSVDRRTGILSAMRRLDREKQDRYVFTVLARDGGKPSIQSNATVVVTVLDQNDNSPSFTHSEYNFYVPENLPMYGTVGLITVTDADAGGNAAVSLSILNDKGYFIIDPNSGVIKPNITFDREQQSSYTFQIMAVDGGRPQRSSVARVTINVVDVNDNSPVFVYPPSNFSYELVSTSASPGSVVGKVFAIDNDTGMNAELRYSIVSGNSRGLFAIDPVTGNITLQEKVTTADHGLYRLVVKVIDLGQPESLHAIALVHLFLNETINNFTYVQDLVRKSMETPLDKNVGDSQMTPQTNDYIKIVIAIIAGTMTVILVIFVTALVRCRHTPRHKTVQKGKQSGEWVSPNQENRQIKKKKRKKKRSPKNLLLNFVTIEESKPDDPAHEHINGTLDLPVELEDQTMGKYNWGTTPTTFKPDSPDLGKHYKSASPQPSFQIKPETPVPVKKHHVIQELPLDNTFVVGCDSLSKCSSSSSDPYSVSECSCQGGFKTAGPIHTRQSQRRVTFHLPDGSQESCSDSGLGDHEPNSSASTSHPLPLGFPQEEYYEQTSPSRTEGDGNSDPESSVEVSLQKVLTEASETCTQECLVLGHSDNCWMPPSLTQYQQPNPPLPSIGFQQSWGRNGRSEGRHTLGRANNKDDIDKSQGSGRQQLYSNSERHCSNEDPVKVIPLANFTPNQQGSVSGDSSPYVREHQL